jgi:serine phosphatase RsbU (regulator of sigma subunit)
VATGVTERELAQRLAVHIDSLQEGYRTLSGAATLKDMAGRFVAVVRPMFPGGEIVLAVRPAFGGAWQVLTGTSTGDPGSFLPPLPESDHSRFILGDGGAGLRAVHRFADGSFVGILIANLTAGAPYGESDVISLRLLVQLLDTAYQALLSRRHEKDLIFSLNHRVLQLNSLIDTGIEVSKLDRGASLHVLALERAAAVTNASRGMVTIEGPDGEKEAVYFPAEGRLPDGEAPEGRIASGFTYSGRTYTFTLSGKESRSGTQAFDETDQLLLDALARQVHASLENRFLHQQALEKQKMEQDIAVAASIQQRILPASLPVIEGYDIAGINIPSKSVGGDYYDCIPLGGGKYALVIADVAGKGIPAALLVSSLHAYLSAYLESSTPLVELARRLNRVICRASTDDKFITAFIAVLTADTGEIESLNAGHNPVFLLRPDGTIRQLNAGGVPFGMLDIDFPYQSEQSFLAPGDRLLLYTDGVTEAADERERLYDSEAPLIDFFVHHRHDRADAFIRDLIADLKRFTGNAPQSDDITALYMMRR